MTTYKFHLIGMAKGTEDSTFSTHKTLKLAETEMRRMEKHPSFKRQGYTFRIEEVK